MSSTLTEVDIANQAMDLLDEGPITALTDTSGRAKFLNRNYATTRDALLRAHPWKFAIQRRRLSPLDFVVDDAMSGTLSGAWGLVRLTPHWSGDIAKIRRDSDSTTDDFTYADSALNLDIDALGTFIGATGTGYVDTLYDQSGNGRSMSQATTGKQPAVDTEAGNNAVPGMVFDGSNDILSTAAALSTMLSTTVGYMVAVGMVDTWTLDSSTASANHVLAADATNKLGLYIRKGGTAYGVNNDGNEDNTTDAVPLGEPFVMEWRHTGSVVYSRVNKGTERSTASGATSSVAGTLNIGDDPSGSQAFDGTIFAVLTFSVIPTEAERNRIVERLMRWVAAGDAQKAPSDWLYRYSIPDDCLRMLPLRTDGEFEGTPIPHEIEKGYVLTDQAPDVYGRYIQQVTDTTRFDPQFVEALTAKLAFKAAHFITGKASYAQTVMGIYNQAIDEAKRSNAFEATPERPYDDDVIAARYNGSAETIVTFPDTP